MSRDTRRRARPTPHLPEARVVEHPTDEFGAEGADLRWRG